MAPNAIYDKRRPALHRVIAAATTMSKAVEGPRQADNNRGSACSLPCFIVVMVPETCRSESSPLLLPPTAPWVPHSPELSNRETTLMRHQTHEYYEGW